LQELVELAITKNGRIRNVSLTGKAQGGVVKILAGKRRCVNSGAARVVTINAALLHQVHWRTPLALCRFDLPDRHSMAEYLPRWPLLLLGVHDTAGVGRTSTERG
jgi:hypothetical protein